VGQVAGVAVVGKVRQDVRPWQVEQAQQVEVGAERLALVRRDQQRDLLRPIQTRNCLLFRCRARLPKLLCRNVRRFEASRFSAGFLYHALYCALRLSETRQPGLLGNDCAFLAIRLE
jgi:hypothetical protein